MSHERWISSIFWIWESGCVGCLTVGSVAYFTARRMKKNTLIVATVILCVLIGLALTVWFSPWSFRGQLLDAGLIAGGFISVVALAFGISSMYRSLVTRLIACVVAGPILVVSVIGIPGVIGVVKAQSDLQPKAVRDIDPEHSYRWVIVGGCHGSCSGAILTVFYHPKSFPFVEKRIWESQYYEQQYDLNFLQLHNAASAEAVQVVRRKQNGELEVTVVQFHLRIALVAEPIYSRYST